MSDIERARRNATKSAAFLQQLGLPFDSDEDRDIHIAIPLRGSGNLHAFPAWPKEINRKNRPDFDIAAAGIRTGRKRTAAKLIARWLAG